MQFVVDPILLAFLFVLSLTSTTTTLALECDGFTEIDTSSLDPFIGIDIIQQCGGSNVATEFNHVNWHITEVSDTEPLRIAMTPPDVLIPLVVDGYLEFCQGLPYQSNTLAG